MAPAAQNASVSERLRSQRIAGIGVLEAGRRNGRTHLVRLGQEGAAKIRLPASDTGILEAVLINTAGGMTGGDRIVWRIKAGEGASVVATTQACEKMYRSAEGHATVEVALAAGAGGRIAWLPQETILFDRSALRRSLAAELDPGASGLFLESVIFGRRAMGEAVGQAMFRDRWRVHVGGALVHAEDVSFGPDVAGQLRRGAVTGGATALATLLAVGEDCVARLDAVRDAIGDAGGASAWAVAGTGKLLARLVAEDGYALRKRLVPLIELLNGEAGLPKVWSL